MMDILAAASVHAAMRQDFPDHFARYEIRERARGNLALLEAFSLLLTRWQRRPRVERPVFPVMTPPL